MPVDGHDCQNELKLKRVLLAGDEVNARSPVYPPP